MTAYLNVAHHGWVVKIFNSRSSKTTIVAFLSPLKNPLKASLWKIIKTLFKALLTSGCFWCFISFTNQTFKKNQTWWPLFMDGVQLLQGYSHFQEAVYFLQLSPQQFLVLILSTSEGWKAESTLEPPGGFENGTLGLGIQRLNH